VAVQLEPEQADVHTTLEYRLDAEFSDWLPIGVLTVFCGLFLFAIAQPGLPPIGETIGASAAIVVGLGITTLALLRRFRPGKPLYVLSPDGIHIRWPMIKEILVPWREIRGVDTVDIPLRHWLTRSHLNMTSAGATVFVVSKEFYDAHIHLDSFFMRGPGWHNNFVVRGELVQCALHAEPVSADPRLLRKAVEERWLAFRDRPAAPASRANAPRIIAAGDKPRRISVWEGVKIALPAIGILVAGSNLLGLWATEAQTAAYQKRKEAAEARVKYERERKAFNDRLEKQRREHDELMRKTFGR
jgi:voltage-gated potassium channel Kch